MSRNISVKFPIKLFSGFRETYEIMKIKWTRMRIDTKDDNSSGGWSFG